MNLTDRHLMALCMVAENAVRQAAEIIQTFTHPLPTSLAVKPEIKTEFKSAGNTLASQVVTQVDLACDKCIKGILKESCERHDIAVLTEESIDDKQRFIKDYFWCVDPLDGTLPFIEGRTGYAVSIALVSQKGTPVIGVV